MRLTPARNAPPCPDAARRGRARRGGAASALAVAVLGLAIPAAAQEPQAPPFGRAPTQPPAVSFGAAPPVDPQRPALQGYPPELPSLPPWANPRTIEFVDGDPILDGYALRTRPNRALMVSGLVTFCASYGLSIITSSLVLAAGGSESDAFAPLVIPFVGPTLSMSITADRDSTSTFIFALDGVLQIGGLLLFAAGFANEDLYLQRQTAGLDRGASPPIVSLRPEVSLGLSSAALRWRF